MTSVTGLLGRGQTKATKLGFTCWPKSLTSSTMKVRSGDANPDNDTWWQAALVEAESMSLAFEGVDEHGTPLDPKRRRFVCWGIVGDNEFFANHLHLPHWNNSDVCMGRCLASATDPNFAWNEFRPSHSLWIKNPLSAEYLAGNHLAKFEHPWFTVQ